MSDRFGWMPGLVLLGMVLVLPLVPSFALIGLVVAALAALVALVALAGAVLAAPYLLGRSILGRLQARHAAGQRNAALTGHRLLLAPSDPAAEGVRVSPVDGDEPAIGTTLVVSETAGKVTV